MTKYKIQIESEECDGDKLCCEEAPNTFALNSDGMAKVINPNGDPPEDILAAAQACPLQAIALYDYDTGKKVWPR